MQLGATGSTGVGVGEAEGSDATVFDDAEVSDSTALDGFNTCSVSPPLLS